MAKSPNDTEWSPKVQCSKVQCSCHSCVLMTLCGRHLSDNSRTSDGELRREVSRVPEHYRYGSQIRITRRKLCQRKLTDEAIVIRFNDKGNSHFDRAQANIKALGEDDLRQVVSTKSEL